MRKKIVAGNWKLNTTVQEWIKLAKEISNLVTTKDITVILWVPFTHLTEVSKVITNPLISTASQNCATEEKWAYTGEISVSMIESTGAKFVILGHSERRQYYGETNEILNKKLALTLKQGLTPIFCCGEPLEIREANTQNEFIINQLEKTIFKLPTNDFEKIIIAYEPIWAIGTGKTATSNQAQEVHKVIRDAVSGKFGSEIAENLSIIYGGSCNPNNAKELFSNPDIDGWLIGWASLKAEDFCRIVEAFNR